MQIMDYMALLVHSLECILYNNRAVCTSFQWNFFFSEIKPSKAYNKQRLRVIVYEQIEINATRYVFNKVI